ncbi:MAG: PAAR domain-containing protein [Phycisphaerales bacterium]
MPPAAQVTGMHICPMQTPTPAGPIPHVGGIIQGPGAATVMVGGMPAAVVGDMCMCVLPAGPTPCDSIVKGSATVMFGGKPAARAGDSTAHGGTLAPPGCPTVMIGG